jgi:hypothetical protein
MNQTADNNNDNNNNGSGGRVPLSQEGLELRPHAFHLQLPVHHRTERLVYPFISSLFACVLSFGCVI